MRKPPIDVPWLIHQYVAEKKTIGEIGAMCGRDARTVHYHLKKHGVQCRKSTDLKEDRNAASFEEMKAQIAEERLAGAKVKDLQEKYAGLGYRRIAGLCAELPTPPMERRRPVFTAEHKSKLSARAKSHYKSMTDDQRARFVAASIEAKTGDNNVNFGRVWGGKGRGTRVPGIEPSGKAVNFRSTWEKKFADALDARGISWRYEPETIRCGALGTYTPDFYIDDWECFVEVKGWMTDGAKAKIQWFRENGDRSLIVATRNVLRKQYGLEIR